MQREQTAEEVLNQSIYPQMRKLTTTEQTQLEKCTCASLGLWPANKKIQQTLSNFMTAI